MHACLTSVSPSALFQGEEGEFDWDARTQSAILGSFYWCYVLSQVMGGLLTQRFGTKVVFGLSQLATAACSLLIPTAAEVHYSLLIALRSVQGVASVCGRGLLQPFTTTVRGLH